MTDSFYIWSEQFIVLAVEEDFFDDNEKWIADPIGECNDLMNKYFNNRYTPKEALEKIKRRIIWKQYQPVTHCSRSTMMTKIT